MKFSKQKWARSKIVCTIGPASNDSQILEQMIEAGMDIVRINFSHGNYEELSGIAEKVRNLDESIAIVTDFCGPKIRIGDVEEPFEPNRGDKISLTTEDVMGTKDRLSISHKNLPSETEPDDYLYINDGLVALKVIEVPDENTIVCEVKSRGLISSRKGLNAPDAKLSLFFPTERDLRDIECALKFEPDFFALSFVRRPEDVMSVRKKVEDVGQKIGLISKIEHRDGVKNFDQILKQSDGIMVARGDLAIEVSTEEVPILQKRLIRKCLQVGKPVITATQMLESMVNNQRPTRAEASDIANAIMDGSDAVMLSAETAVGKFPVETVHVMKKIAANAELLVHQADFDFFTMPDSQKKKYQHLLGQAAADITRNVHIDAILATTMTGSTAQLVAKYRPKPKIIASTPYQETARRLQLIWGVIPLIVDVSNHTDSIIYNSIEKSIELGIMEKSDVILIIKGTLLGVPSYINSLQICKAHEILSLDRFEPLGRVPHR